MLDTKDSMRIAVAKLKRGRNLALLIDQHARQDGIFVRFLGKPASTHTSAARLAMYTGARIAFVYARRIEGQNCFHFAVKDAILPDLTAQKGPEVFRIAQRLPRDLEDVVRWWPAERLWLQPGWGCVSSCLTGLLERAQLSPKVTPMEF